jgi:hypothetical protein
MPIKHTLDAKVRTLVTGLAMGESPRWHENRLWLSDWSLMGHWLPTATCAPFQTRAGMKSS